MIRVDELIKELKKFPGSAQCYAYQGEDDGIVIVTGKEKYITDRAFIHASEMD